MLTTHFIVRTHLWAKSLNFYNGKHRFTIVKYEPMLILKILQNPVSQKHKFVLLDKT